MSIFHKLESDVTNNLRSANILTRPNASNGLWITLLLPLCMTASIFCYPTSNVYKETAVCSIGLALTSIIFIFYLAQNDMNISPFLGCGFPIIVVSVLQVVIAEKNIIFSIASAVVTCIPLQQSIIRVLKQCPLSFTVGEALLVVQAVVLFLFAAILNMHNSFTVSPQTDIEIITLILQVGLLGVFYVVTTLYFIGAGIEISTFLIVVILHILGLLGTLHLALGESPLMWIIRFLLDDLTRLNLILYWMIATTTCVITVIHQTTINQIASTSCRKIFHILAILVFIPGILIDFPLIYLASGIAFAVLIALETIRMLDLGWLSDMLNSSFHVFADEKDVGGISLTPLYLLAGISCPVWLQSSACFASFAGILSVGIGDTAASYIGSTFGRNTWTNSKKSYEGTASSIIFQLLAVYLFIHFGILELNMYGYIAGLIAIITNALVEAKTDQIDNLTLPLITFFILIMA